MTAFAFSTVAHIVSEPGAASRLGEIVRERFPSSRRALVVTDAGFLRTGLAEMPCLDLKRQGFTVSVFSGVVADPPEDVVMAAVDFARANDTDLVIGLGGGSSMDVAKLVAVLTASEQPLAEIYGIGKVTGSRLPLVQVATTAGTGS
ncbi:MAG TPA: alcohol dehydrogenase, partial [Massilia sp.]|nr:alcohol dehydrogenase [Massilia sp.]